jgi:hypothetical protein
VPAVLLAAALAAAATACGSSSSSGAATAVTTTGSSTTSASAAGSPALASASAASTGKLTGATATALLAKAFADSKAAPSVVVKDTAVSSGTADQSVSFDVALLQKGGCQGTVAESKTDAMQLVVTDGWVWLKATSGFYASLKFSQAELALVADKWLKARSTDSQVSSLVQNCSFSYMFGQLKTPTGTSYVATPTTYEGQSAYEVTVPGQQGDAYVTNSATPMLAKLATTGTAAAVITFTDYGAPLTITAPSAAETIDGTAFGF